MLFCTNTPHKEVQLIDSENKKIFLDPYQPQTVLSILVITAVVATIFVTVGATGQFSRIPSPHFPAWKSSVISCAVIGTVGGAFFIMHKARQNQASGKLVGSSHWHKCVIRWENQEKQNCWTVVHADFSRLDQSSSGVAPLYGKPLKIARQVGGFAALFMPIYVLCVIVYNALRTLIAPIYIVVQILRETRNGEPLFPKERSFSLLDIPKQMAISIGRAIQAPFYGLAMFFTALYILVDPLNGMKWGAAIEYDWNGQVPLRHSGVWMVGFTIFENWKWEGGGGPNNLGKNGFYYAGSWSPYAKLICKNGVLINVENEDKSEPNIQALLIEEVKKLKFKV